MDNNMTPGDLNDAPRRSNKVVFILIAVLIIVAAGAAYYFLNKNNTEMIVENIITPAIVEDKKMYTEADKSTILENLAHSTRTASTTKPISSNGIGLTEDQAAQERVRILQEMKSAPAGFPSSQQTSSSTNSPSSTPASGSSGISDEEKLRILNSLSR